MNDQQILAHIAAHPGARASELANAGKATLADVSASLRSLVDVGDIVKRTHFDDDTGRQCQVYELSAEFRRSRSGKELLAGLEKKTEVAPVATPVLAKLDSPLPAAAAAPAPAAQPATTKKISKIELAIDHVRKHGPSKNAQVSAAMGLPAGTYPRNWLARALKDGSLQFDGTTWSLGTGTKPARPAAARKVEGVANVVTVGNLVLASKDSKAIAPAVVAAVAAVGGGEPPAPDYRCAHWSDGTIELQLGGTQVARLSEQELAFINSFMAKRRAA